MPDLCSQKEHTSQDIQKGRAKTFWTQQSSVRSTAGCIEHIQECSTSVLGWSDKSTAEPSSLDLKHTVLRKCG